MRSAVPETLVSGDGGRNIADLRWIEIGERAAEREDGAEGVALVHLHVECPDAGLGELVGDGAQRARRWCG